MSAAKKLPAGLPKLPPVPEGFDAWEYMGKGWAGECEHSALLIHEKGEWVHWSGKCLGTQWAHYIRAIKRPAKLKKPKQAKAVKAVRHCVLGGGRTSRIRNTKPLPEGSDCFVLPADKASVERMREQAMRAVINDPDATLGDTITAVFASIGITSTKGRK